MEGLGSPGSIWPAGTGHPSARRLERSSLAAVLSAGWLAVWSAVWSAGELAGESAGELAAVLSAVWSAVGSVHWSAVWLVAWWEDWSAMESQAGERLSRTYVVRSFHWPSAGFQMYTGKVPTSKSAGAR